MNSGYPDCVPSFAIRSRPKPNVSRLPLLFKLTVNEMPHGEQSLLSTWNQVLRLWLKIRAEISITISEQFLRLAITQRLYVCFPSAWISTFDSQHNNTSPRTLQSDR
jgi:hypothetical protein